MSSAWRKTKRAYLNEAKGNERTKLRNTKRKLLKMTREEIEDSDIQSFKHRHAVMWDIT